jgi:hypothetical protein
MDLTLGIAFAIASGLMNGTFTLPMRFLGRWSWENVWALFVLVSCVVMPVAIAWITFPGFTHALGEAPTRAVLLALVTGFMWGFGAIMFGQGVSAAGASRGIRRILEKGASAWPFSQDIQKSLVFRYLTLKQIPQAREALRRYVALFPLYAGSLGQS